MAVQEPSMQLLAEAAQNQAPLPDNELADDQRSSSLSDIDDNNESEVEAADAAESGNELSLHSSDVGEEENDTEAETERLEESPDKLRRQKKVLLNADNEAINTSVTPVKDITDRIAIPDTEPDKDDKDEVRAAILNATSPISSPVESEDELSAPASPSSSSSRKRKRGHDVSSSDTKKAAMQLLKKTIGENLTKADKDSAEFIIQNINGKQKITGKELLDESRTASPAAEEEERNPSQNEIHEEEAEAAESNEDVEMDEAAPEIERTTKSEADLVLRKEAADKVCNIEEQFAVFREKMFNEALSNLKAEQASLEADEPTHPDYLAILAAISHQKEARIRLVRARFFLQVKNWQKRGIAEQAQYYSQYAQACRDIRDTALTKTSEEWYQIQKGRRPADEIAVVPLSSYKKVDLVAQQTAYNTEVSILSGIAKYVGFPAAPELAPASQAEIEEDLKAIGSTMPIQRTSQVASYTSQYLKQSHAAEKQFSLTTPWANPQHHAHGLHAAPSWSPARPNSPFTPATQSQQGDIPAAVAGSASTIVGSHAPTPLSSEVTGSNSKGKGYGNMGETPSRNPLVDRPRSTAQAGYAPPPRIRMQAPTSLVDNTAEFSSPGGIVPELRAGMA